MLSVIKASALSLFAMLSIFISATLAAASIDAESKEENTIPVPTGATDNFIAAPLFSIAEQIFSPAIFETETILLITLLILDTTAFSPEEILFPNPIIVFVTAFETMFKKESVFVIPSVLVKQFRISFFTVPNGILDFR